MIPVTKYHVGAAAGIWAPFNLRHQEAILDETGLRAQGVWYRDWEFMNYSRWRGYVYGW